MESAKIAESLEARPGYEERKKNERFAEYDLHLLTFVAVQHLIDGKG